MILRDCAGFYVYCLSPSVSHLFKKPWLPLLGNGIKMYVLELNVLSGLSGQCKEIYALVPPYVYTPNYKDFYVEFSVSILS